MQIKKTHKLSPVFIQVLIILLVLVILLSFILVFAWNNGKSVHTANQTVGSVPARQFSAADSEVATEPPTEPEPEGLLTYPEPAPDMMTLTASNITAKYAVLLDVDHNTILEQRDYQEKIYPASMTKVMALLVAAEQVDNLEDTVTLTSDIIDPLVEEDASRAGFEAGETVTVQDLLYGMALPSGADATEALAIYLAGDESAFVELMNDKVAELGLKHTHFTNASGLHDEDHYSTPEDIAMLMAYAMENPLCSEIMGTYQYTTSQTEQHPEGILLESTMFNRMYGSEVTGMTILAGKTGFTDQAMHCLVSYAESEDGGHYVAVTAYAPSRWRSVFDSFAIYGIVTNGYEMPTDLDLQEFTETDENGSELSEWTDSVTE